ncbi:MAG TPA: DUF1376 domain-containing protein [Stellaceae bacterium]|jgi:uncharacterized protein YdaU (DUF1376 family)|nr:DUF1376 domain-containing protein [Stellaceae bacterium]
MKRPWMPFWPRDYLGDTQHLTTAQHGAYFLLILHYWTHGGLPDDDRELATITRMPLATWRKIRSVIAPFFGPGWRHDRIERDLVAADQVSERRRLAGSIGGTASAIARWGGKQPSSKRAAIVQQNGQQNGSKTAATVKLPEEDIDRPVSEAARARPETPEISDGSMPPAPPAPQPPPPGPAKGLADKAREAVQKSTDIASDALHDTMRQKGWLR